VDQQLQEKVVFRGNVFDVVIRGFQTLRGVAQQPIVRHPGSVAILPLLDESHVVLIRQFRPAVAREMLEIPAGTLKAGESPDEAAKRELQEETGYQADSWHLLTTVFPSPGTLTEQMHLFLAEKLQAGRAHPDPDESIETVVTSLAESIRLIRLGQIIDAKTIIAILWYTQFGTSLT